MYEWVFENYLIVELPFDSVLTYTITLLFVDMAYYWFHRAAHGKTFLNITLVCPNFLVYLS